MSLFRATLTEKNSAVLNVLAKNDFENLSNVPFCALHPLEVVDESVSVFTGTFNVFWHIDKLLKTCVFAANSNSFLAALKATVSNQRRRVHRNTCIKPLEAHFFHPDVWGIVWHHTIKAVLRNTEITGCSNIHLSEELVITVFVGTGHIS